MGPALFGTLHNRAARSILDRSTELSFISILNNILITFHKIRVEHRVMVLYVAHNIPVGKLSRRPWINLDNKIPSSVQASAEPHQCNHPVGQCEACWDFYTQSPFPNWMPEQVYQSRIKSLNTATENCAFIVSRSQIAVNSMIMEVSKQEETMSSEEY